MSDQSINSHSALNDVDDRSLLEDADGDLFDVEQDFDPFAELDDDELDAMLAKAEGGFDATASGVPEGFRSGFVALVGRPNAGQTGK